MRSQRFDVKTRIPFQNWSLFTITVCSVLGTLLIVFVVSAAGQGTITSLTAGNSNPSNVSATLLAGTSKINNSNIRFQVFDSGNNLVGSYGPVDVTLDPRAANR